MVLSWKEFLLIGRLRASVHCAAAIVSLIHRCLSDSAAPVRRRAAFALSKLAPLQPRLDPLLSELATMVEGSASFIESGVREAAAYALCGILETEVHDKAKSFLSGTKLNSAVTTLVSEPEEELRAGIARLYAHLMDPSEILTQASARDLPAAIWESRHGLALALENMLKLGKSTVETIDWKMLQKALGFEAADDRVPIRASAAAAAGFAISRFASSSIRRPS